MPRQSTQHKLERLRPPRVHITYEVEAGGAIEVQELPFVIAVLGTFRIAFSNGSTSTISMLLWTN